MQTIKEFFQGSDYSFTDIRFDKGNTDTLGERIRAAVYDLGKDGYIITEIDTFTDVVRIRVSKKPYHMGEHSIPVIPEAALDGKESYKLPNVFIWKTVVYDTNEIEEVEPSQRTMIATSRQA